MEDKIVSLDFSRSIGEVTLGDGETKLSVPRVSIKKIIKIVKFLGVDAYKLYDDITDIFQDGALDEFEKLAAALDEIKEEQIVRILSILLEISDEDALELDPDEVLDILLVYAREVSVENLYQKARKLAKDMFDKELPEPGNIIETIFPKEMQEEARERMEAKKQQKEAASKTGSENLTDSLTTQ